MKRLTWFSVVLTLLCLAAISVIEFVYLSPISGGLKSPDYRFTGYTYEQFATWLDYIGPNGAQLYLSWMPMGLGRVFPALAGVSIALIFHAVSNQFPRYQSRSTPFKTLLPIALALPYVIFDYFENAVIADAIVAGGNAGPSLIAFASSLTVSKFSFLAIALLIIGGLWLATLNSRKAENS